MSKKSHYYPDRIEAFSPPGTRAKLVAIAYHMGARGEFATPVRNFIAKGIRDYIAGLKGDDLKDFEEIFRNVEIQLSPQARDLKQKTPA